MGTASVVLNPDIESVIFYGGGGNDIFNINTYRSGSALTINGGGGDDTVNWTPASNNLADITSIASFSYNGGGGTADRMNVYNGSSASVYGYYVSPGYFSTFSSSTLTMGHSNIEHVLAIAGSAGDQFNIFGTNAGTTIELTGQGGNDVYQLSQLIGTTLQSIASPVIINGAGGADQISLYNGESTVGRIAHILSDSVGTVPGDNIFSPGGSVRFYNVAGSVTLTNGSGADTTYVAPNATATFNVYGNNPTTSPGDSLNLAFGEVSGAVFTGAGTGAGGYTFANRAPLNYTGIESVSMDTSSPNVSATAINFDAPSPSAQRSNLSSLAIEFGEPLNIASLIANGTIDSYIRLFYTTDTLTAGATTASATAGTAVPWIDESRFQFDAPSATLYIDLTTDGFGGANTTKLDNARYQLRITTSAFMDSYGNTLRDNDGTADGVLVIDRTYGAASQDLFRLGGDLDGDADVDLNDLGALATYYGGGAGGDCDGDGDTDLADLGLLSTYYGTTLPQAIVTTTVTTANSETPASPTTDQPIEKKPKGKKTTTSKNKSKTIFV